MSKFLRLGLVILIAASGLAVASTSSAQVGVPPLNDCENTVGEGDLIPEDTTIAGVPGAVVANAGKLGVVTPSDIPVTELANRRVTGDQGVCANLYRTLVFIGVAGITNGVNFAGSYSAGDLPTPGTAAVTEGTYDFPLAASPSICVMVDWENVDASVSGLSPVTDCAFNQNQSGVYGGPQAGGQTPVIQQLFADTANGGLTEDLGDTLAWDPANQPSCFDSDGSGEQSFTADGVRSAGPETWRSSDANGNVPGNFSWDNGLSNLRGSITDTPGEQDRTFPFDAKIEAHAAPNGALIGGNAFDATDAGCLQKNLVKLGGSALQLGAPIEQTGLNYILIAGTASWEVTVPSVL
jgi:hypothetical protein